MQPTPSEGADPAGSAARHAPGQGEGQLVARAQEGDRAAFDDLVRLHFHGIHRMLQRLVGSHEDAEDLAQETFARAWAALALYRPEASFASWLRRVALHLAHDHFRRRGRRVRTADEARALLAPGPSARDPHAAAQHGELFARLAAALHELPVRLRAAFVLRVLDGAEYDDVARSAGITPATARTHVMQARKRLLAALRPWLEHPSGPPSPGGER